MARLLESGDFRRLEDDGLRLFEDEVAPRAASLTAAFGTLTLVGSASVQAAAAAASATIPLGTLSAAAAATNLNRATTNKTFGALVVTATSKVQTTSVLTKTLSPLTTSAVANALASATLAKTFAPMAAASQAGAIVDLAASVSFGGLTLGGASTVSNDVGLASTFSPLSLSATAAGVLQRDLQSNLTFGTLGLLSQAEVQTATTAQVFLDGLIAESNALSTVSLGLTKTLSSLLVSATLEADQERTLRLNVDLGDMVVSGESAVSSDAQLASMLGTLSLVASSQGATAASANVTFAALVLQSQVIETQAAPLFRRVKSAAQDRTLGSSPRASRRLTSQGESRVFASRPAIRYVRSDAPQLRLVRS